MQIATHSVNLFELIELALIVAVLWLRRGDRARLSHVDGRISRVAKHQGKLVEIVKSSLAPPSSSRCAECDHEHHRHFGSLGQAQTCDWRLCSCEAWADPIAALDFSDVTPSDRPERS